MIYIREGDLLQSKCQIICHQVNCHGVMGAGLAKQIRNIFPTVYEFYKERCQQNNPKILLGTIDIIPVAAKYICNLYAQLNFSCGKQCTDYSALTTCLIKLKSFCDATLKDNQTLGLPYNLGCGLGGGNWNYVYKIIKSIFNDTNYNVEIWKI